MKKHVKIYMDASGYDQEEFIPCEVCGYPATDIHHIKRRGMGGSKKADEIGNLMALCRLCHAKAHAYPKLQKPILQRVHDAVVESWGAT
jgi:hypothetical protein